MSSNEPSLGEYCTMNSTPSDKENYLDSTVDVGTTHDSHRSMDMGEHTTAET